MIGVIDCNVGNIGSICNILSLLDAPYSIVTQTSQLDACQKFILPGVGAFDTVARNIADSGLFDGLESQVLGKGKFLMGICVGLQILCNGSDEGTLKGFGWLDTQVKKFEIEDQLKVPHMGWNQIVDAGGMAIFDGVLEQFSRFYFLHSYYVDICPQYQHATTQYGRLFSCAVQRDNIIGVQFHPEKSHKYGIQLIENFAKLA